MSRARVVTSAVFGFVFAIGLGISGMTDANKVLAFLNLAGDWDMSLAVVMAAALLVFAPAYRLYWRHRTPILGGGCSVPPPDGKVDGKLVAGSVLFGVGWGIAGFCPGPALVSTASGSATVLTFVGAMLVGIILQRAQGARVSKHA